MAQTQKYSPESVENLASAFPRRAENSFAWGNVISIYLGLPQLRAFWPMSTVNETGNPYDLSGQGRILTNTGAATFGVDSLQSYSVLAGGNYFVRADEAGLDITGALTFGAWIRPDAVNINQGVMSKWAILGNNRSYYLQLASAVPTGQISSLGTAASVVTVSSTLSIAANTWSFVAVRFVPNTSLDIFVNSTLTQNLVGIPAAIFNSTAGLILGAINAGAAENYAGDIALPFLCATSCSNAQINALYWLSRSLFFGS